MTYKQTLIDLFTDLSNDGLEGTIPTLIVECLQEGNFRHNTNNKMLENVRDLCDKKLKLDYSEEVSEVMINH